MMKYHHHQLLMLMFSVTVSIIHESLKESRGFNSVYHSGFFPSQHTDVQLLLAQTEKNYFETKLKLDRVSGEKQALLQENRSLESDRDDLRQKLRQVTQENVQLKDR